MDKQIKMGKGDLAAAYFEQGYNCSQAVLLAFVEECGMDEKTAMKISSSFFRLASRMHTEVTKLNRGLFTGFILKDTMLSFVWKNNKSILKI